MNRIQRFSYLRLIFILGFLSMLVPIAIDMYLPSLPSISKFFCATTGQVQMTLNSYIFGFAIGQIFYGPISDSFGRKPVIFFGVAAFSIISFFCALVNDINLFIFIRFFQGLFAASSIVISALMKDIFDKDEFSRSMSFVLLIMTIAPLLAPIIGGIVIAWFSWHIIFWIIFFMSLIGVLLIVFYIEETLEKKKRQDFSLKKILKNFIFLFRSKKILFYTLSSGFSFAGLFSFLNSGPFVYIELYKVSPQQFGYYFSLNIVFLFFFTFLNSFYVRYYGASRMLNIGLLLQFLMGLWLFFTALFNFGFLSLLFGVAIYIGCISMISANAMSVILSNYQHISGIVSSFSGAIRFGIGASIGYFISFFKVATIWVMIGFMGLCVFLAFIFLLIANRLKN